MTKKFEIYRCNVCGNMVEIIKAGAGTLVCCGQPMELLGEEQEEMLNEKHVPVVERSGGSAVVSVGSVAHPMEPKHYIEWIEIFSGENASRKFLSPGQKPEAVFPASENPERAKPVARAYCNIHGLWKSRE